MMLDITYIRESQFVKRNNGKFSCKCLIFAGRQNKRKIYLGDKRYMRIHFTRVICEKLEEGKKTRKFLKCRLY